MGFGQQRRRHRHHGGRRPDPVINDPFAEPLVRAVGLDLIVASGLAARPYRLSWPTALQSAGFDPVQPTAWLAEGVLIGFLPPEAEVRLLDHVTALSAAGSRFAADHGSVHGQTEEQQRLAKIITDRWREHGLDLHIPDLTYPGEHTDVAAHLRAQAKHRRARPPRSPSFGLPGDCDESS
jgi:O-methyltransferase involved in polyketide biosynthesis